MISILDSSSQRIIQILIILLEKKDWITTKYLSEQLKVSEKTIWDDIRLIEESWHDSLEIESSPLKGIFINNLNVSKLLDLQSQILLQSVSIKFLKSLFYYPKQDLNYYADKLHVSRSTLYRYLPKINLYLEQFDIHIDNANALYFVTSKKELTLRRFFTTLFLEISGYHTESFISEEMMFFLGSRIKDSYQINQEKISKLQVHFYLVLYFVSIKREEQGFSLNYNHLFSGNISPLTEEQIYLQKKYSKDLSTSDIYRIEKSFLILRHSLNNSTDEHLETTIPHFLNRLFIKYNLNKNSPIYQELLYYMKDLYLSEKYIAVPFHVIHNRFTYFSKEVLRDNEYVYNEIKNMVKKLSNDTSVDFNRDFDYILYILITLLPDIMLVKFEKNILVVSNYSNDHANFLLKFIQGQLNIDLSYFEHVKSISKEALDSYNLDNFHLIISNSTLKDINHNTIIINDFPSDEDLEKIKNKIIR